MLLIAFGVFYLYSQIVADSCERLISYADKYVLLRPLTWMIKPLATASLEQETESLTMVFLVPDDGLRMPWHTGYRGECMQKRLNVLRFKTWRFLHDCSCIIAFN